MKETFLFAQTWGKLRPTKSVQHTSLSWKGWMDVHGLQRMNPFSKPHDPSSSATMMTNYLHYWLGSEKSLITSMLFALLGPPWLLRGWLLLGLWCGWSHWLQAGCGWGWRRFQCGCPGKKNDNSLSNSGLRTKTGRGIVLLDGITVEIQLCKQKEPEGKTCIPVKAD